MYIQFVEYWSLLLPHWNYKSLVLLVLRRYIHSAKYLTTSIKTNKQCEKKGEKIPIPGEVELPGVSTLKVSDLVYK